MVPVVNTQIIGHIFNLLVRHGITETRVNVHYLADVLLEAYGEESHLNGMGVHLVKEEELTGPASGAKRLTEVAGDYFDETFVVVSSDALTDIDLQSLVAFHKKKGAVATIALRRVYDTSEFGVVELDEEGNSQASPRSPTPKKQ